ncbi:predicted protein [Sclerotinia sclerotiorum 1980 UF-70]|uniref:Uncharacterized protein n=1 Tax=Sclerotinia sclerotiorum (strain ATCC 18683 / 1980 / Ss-1) TaxID=665079 RepID=A7EJM5_SCLS1|nr:predicted protein [Sclerotinia sclerotiorum 1980 UF-70]EDO03041.1 predicted protein [Sclerotinia sclerotiorum 1980 UF-70]
MELVPQGDYGDYENEANGPSGLDDGTGAFVYCWLEKRTFLKQ